MRTTIEIYEQTTNEDLKYTLNYLLDTRKKMVQETQIIETFEGKKKINELNKRGGKGNYIDGSLGELTLGANLQVSEGHTTKSEQGKIDLYYKGVTIETKFGTSAFAKFHDNGNLKSVTHSMFFCVCSNFSPFKDLTDDLAFIPYDLFLKWCIDNHFIVRGQATHKNKQRDRLNLPHIYTELKFRVRNFSFVDIEELKKIGYNYNEFITLVDNRKAGENLIDYNKIDKIVLEFWNRWDNNEVITKE